MNILSTTTTSRYRNDCYIEESYSLVEQFGLYAVIHFCKVSGWTSSEEVTIKFSSSSKVEAAKIYKNYCKYYKN